jgi:penicillin amidase
MRCLLPFALLAFGCGETQLGPFQALPIDTRFDIEGNDGIIHVARDRFGVSHIFATTFRDLGFAQGYVMAHDRLAQMDVLRRMAEGRLAELFGAVDDTGTIVAFDREMRFHHIQAFATDRWGAIDAGDSALKDTLVRFADGVNAYVADVNAGTWTIDPAVSKADTQLYGLFAPAQFAPWTPVDSLAILHLFTISQSWTAPEELALTDLDVRARRTLPAAAASDLLALAPIPPPGATPEVPVPRAGTATRPAVPDQLLASARAFFAPALPPDLARFGLGPHAFARPFLGSTAFAVGPQYTSRGALLAADMEVAPTNPSLFYPAHQIVAAPGDVVARDVAGLMLPGVPVPIAGTNGAVGWAPTRNLFDVSDVYYEQLVQQGDTTYVGRGFDLVPVDPIVETIGVGEYGNIVREETVTYEVVRDHGPLIPDHPTDQALSVRYTGFGATDEIVTLWSLAGATDARNGRDILREMKHGPQFMLVDNFGGMVWASDTLAPVRGGEALAWSPSSPNAGAPFFVLDGRNPAQAWSAVESKSITYGQLEESAIVIADADPTIATRDGDPLNDTYVGAAYANGLRDARIQALIATASQPIDESKLARIQHDTLSTLGERLKPRLVEILTAAPADARTTIARDVLDAWNLETPIGSVSADRNAAATLLFNTWMHHFARLAIGDELTQIGYTGALDDDRIARIVYRMLVENQQALCNGACAPLVAQAAILAVDQLGSDPDAWRWGSTHALALRPLFPDPTGTLVLPGPLEPARGLEIPGDMFSVDRADGGWADTDFTPELAAAYRLQLTGASGTIALRLELPTGSVLDTRDPHYRDLLERSYLTRTAFDVPFSIDQINRAGESRWEFR